LITGLSRRVRWALSFGASPWLDPDQSGFCSILCKQHSRTLCENFTTRGCRMPKTARKTTWFGKGHV